MSYEESKERRRANLGFRTVMDLGMGIFYTVIGLFLVYFKAFGTMPVPTWIAYLLGGMMAIGGLFRFYRGVQAILQSRKERG